MLSRILNLFSIRIKLWIVLSFFLSLIVATCTIKRPPLRLFGFFPVQNANKFLVLENTDALFTNEFGRAASFTIRLSMEPDDNVTIGPITSQNEAEGKVISDQYIVFSPANFNQPRTITIAGVDDGLADGNQGYEISLGRIQTNDYSYSLLTPPNVRAINTDRATASIAASPTMGLFTNESGTTASFSVVLSTQPGADVTLSGFTTSSAECSIQTGSLTFTPQNWDTPQSVIVKGMDDTLIDGPANCLIGSQASTSADQVYVGKTIPTVTIVNVDNDIAGFTFIPVTSAVTTESGGQASFKIVMNTNPYGTISINGITSADLTEGNVSPTNLSFDSSNWNVGHLLTVVGVDDYMQDGNINYSLVFPNSTATDPLDAPYANLPVGSPGSFTNQDNDIRGYQIIPVAPTASLSPLTIREGSPAKSFQVRLTSQPCESPSTPENCTPGSVTIHFTNNNTDQYTISTDTLTFSTADWNTYQTITVQAVDDFIDDGDLNFTLRIEPISSTTDYNEMDPNDIALVVENNDTAGFTVNPSGGVTVNENDPGGTGLETTITVRLTSQPLAPVTITPIQSSDTLEITIAPTTIGDNTPITNRTLVFTPTTGQLVTNTDASTSTGGWDMPQTIRVRAVIDGTLDGTQTREVRFMGRSTTDPKYSNVVLTPLNPVLATNEDSGTPKVLIQSISTTSFPEDDTSTITFQIVLATLPTNTVTISNIITSDDTEGVVLPHGGGAPITNRTLVFNTTTNQVPTGTSTTTGGWNEPQTITVRSVGDGFDDGDISFKILIPGATGAVEYVGKKPEGSNPAYSNGELTLTNIDNDTKGVVFTPNTITASGTPLEVTEGGVAQTFTVVLSSDPCTTPTALQNCTSGALTVNFTNSNTSQYTISPSSVTFNAGNPWNTPQTVTVTAVNDAYDETNMDFQLVTSITSSGTDYEHASYNPDDIAIRVIDNDSRGINLTLATGYSHVVSSAGGYTVYNLTLNSSPLPGRTVTVTASVPITAPQEGKILDSDNVTQLDSRVFSFDSTNWNTSQTFRVRGLTGSGTGSASFNLSFSAAEDTSTPAGYSAGQYLHYNGLTRTPQAITNYHIGAGKKIRLAAASTDLSFSESTSGTLRYAYVLLNQLPTHDVALTFDIDSATGCTLVFSDSTPSSKQFNVNTTSLTIPKDNWNQITNTNRVEFAAVNDVVDDGDASCALRITSVTSVDPYYNNALNTEKEEPTILVTDDDTRGIQIANQTPFESSRLITSNSGATATLSYRLTRRPLTNVTLSFSDTGGQAIYPSDLTFTPSNYNTYQPITVTGNVTGATADVNYTIVAMASSGEPTLFTNSNTYNGFSVNQNAVNRYLLYDLVACTSTDVTNCGTANAGGGVVTSSYTTAETGTLAYFGIKLRARPSSDVTIPITNANPLEGSVSPLSLTFTNGNWNTFQVVTITGVDDFLQDGNIIYNINFGAMTGDSAFTQTIPSLTVTNQDND
jgi:hypothetical protein